jgi:hypothetical protein
MAQDGHAAGQDARLSGRQDARRYMAAVPGCNRFSREQLMLPA